mgnify:CR=1 FL=1
MAYILCKFSDIILHIRYIKLYLMIGGFYGGREAAANGEGE